jgi:hypothetical protein
MIFIQLLLNTNQNIVNTLNEFKTNLTKEKTFQQQLIDHNKRRMKVLIIKNILLYQKKCQSFAFDTVIKSTNIKVHLFRLRKLLSQAFGSTLYTA